MLKIIRRFGSSIGIYFTKEEKTIHKLQIGDMVSIGELENISEEERKDKGEENG